jgi:hypothetical protein
LVNFCQNTRLLIPEARNLQGLLLSSSSPSSLVAAAAAAVVVVIVVVAVTVAVVVAAVEYYYNTCSLPGVLIFSTYTNDDCNVMKGLQISFIAGDIKFLWS